MNARFAPALAGDSSSAGASYSARPETPSSYPGRDPHLTRRAFLGVAGAATVGLGLYAGEIARHDLVTERHSFAVENLPEAFDGFRIAQISDFHFGEYTEPGYIRRVVKEVNALKPDLVLLTGDFISMGPVNARGAEAYAPLCAEVLAGLSCPERYGVLGNHDFMVNPAAVIAAMAAVKIRILDDEYVPVERAGKRIWVAGLADAFSKRVDIAKAVPRHAIVDKEPVLLMAHEPDLLDLVAPYGVDLMFSGHTHGGQVKLPFLPPMALPPLGQKYVEGAFKLGRTQLYVNRGIGAVGLPFRFRCPPEITEITLKPV